MSEGYELKEAEFNTALSTHDVNKMRELFNTIPTVDLAEFADHVEDPATLTFIFKVVKSELTADFFTELDDRTQEKLLISFTDNELVELANKSYTDDIVDVLEDMPANLVNRALKFIPKEKREAVNKLLNYKQDTAASIMTTEYFELRHDITVEEAMKKIREKGKQAETIYTVFLRDETRNLVGTVDLDDIIFAKKEQKLDEIKNKEFIYTNVNADQEEVAKIFKRYDLNALAVANNENKLVGVITVDDIMDVIEKETTEDIALQAGVLPLKDEYEDVGPVKMALKCAPWLCVLVVLGVLSSAVVSGFEDVIKSYVVLAAFMPIIMNIGGNAGGQTCSVFIRSLALKDYDNKEYFKMVWKEIKTAFFTGIMVFAAAFFIFLIEMLIPGLINYPGSDFGKKCIVSLVVASTLFLAIFTAKLVGCLLPFLAVKLKKDPALMCEPVVTNIVDIVALLTYFGIVTTVIAFGFKF